MKLVFLANHDRYFWSHRLSLARAARDAGAEVFLMMRLYDRDSGAALEREGFRVINWRLSQRSLNPFRELAAFAQVLNAYRRIRPDLAHHVTLKPIVYGEGAAKLCGQIPSVNTIAGLGSVFSTTKWGMRPVRRALLMLLRPALRGRNSRTVFQNSENRDALLKDEVVPFERTAIIRGSGVNLREFAPRPEPVGAPVVMLASRMLWEKGVAEFVSAAQILRQRGVTARFVLVGDPDPNNPAPVPARRLRAWADSGIVESWGHREDMPSVLNQCNAFCLPSYYGEGLPKVLIEAAACGRAIVTTDVPGCREVVRHGESGLLVPPRDPEALARALATLLGDPALRGRMGARGREIVEQEFSEELVVQRTFALYRELLGGRWPDCRAKPHQGEALNARKTG